MQRSVSDFCAHISGTEARHKPLHLPIVLYGGTICSSSKSIPCGQGISVRTGKQILLLQVLKFLLGTLFYMTKKF